jgi:hypothetical protein
VDNPKEKSFRKMVTPRKNDPERLASRIIK